MGHVLLSVIIVVLVFLAGCAKPCFYQAGKSLEQCKRDLRDCIEQARGQQKSPADKLTRSCMKTKGYECLDKNKAPQGAKRIVVIAPFEKYGVLDGSGATAVRSTVEAKQSDQGNQVRPETTATPSSVAAQEKPQESAPQIPTSRQVGYRARLDANGKYVITPVYEGDLKKEADSAQ